MAKNHRHGRIAAIVVTVLALVAIAATVYADQFSPGSDPAGDVTEWNVRDGSGRASPVGVVDAVLVSINTGDEPPADEATVDRRRRGRVTHLHVANRTGPAHRQRGRGQANIWCRTARAVGIGGNDMIHDLVHGTISQRFCWNPARNKVVSLGGINVSSGTSVLGSTFLWHGDGFGPTVAGEGRTCSGRDCWDYRYRRGQFKFARGIEVGGVGIVQRISVCASITMRGTGRVIVGKPRC